MTPALCHRAALRAYLEAHLAEERALATFRHEHASALALGLPVAMRELARQAADLAFESVVLCRAARLLCERALAALEAPALCPR